MAYITGWCGKCLNVVCMCKFMFVLLAWIIVIFILHLEAVHLALYALALCGKMLTLIISL